MCYLFVEQKMTTSNPNKAVSAAETACDKLGFAFEDVFRLQYRITDDERPSPPGYLRYSIASFELDVCPAMPITRLKDKAGRPVGLCLGLAVDSLGVLLRETYHFEFEKTSPEFGDLVEKEILAFAGRYLVFLTIDRSVYAFGDPAGALPLVYNTNDRVAGSSMLLAIEHPVEPNQNYSLEAITGLSDITKLSHDMAREKGSSGFSFGDTADRRVRRLHPNHRLRLDDFIESRCWPADGDAFVLEPMDPAAAAELIVTRMGRVANALAEAGETHFALSGGFDSRMLLAAALKDGFHPSIELHSHMMNWATKMDARSAELIAAALGKPIRIIVPEGGPRGTFKSREQQSMAALRHDISCGFASAINGQIQRGCLDWLPQDCIWMRGNMLELVAAVWWPQSAKAQENDVLAHAVYRSQVSVENDVERVQRYQQMSDWVGNLPKGLHRVLHDMNYIENTLPNTQANLISVNHCFYAPPACDRAVFSACMAIDPTIRMRRHLYLHIMHASRPDLLKVPTSIDIAAQRRARKKQKQS